MNSEKIKPEKQISSLISEKIKKRDTKFDNTLNKFKANNICLKMFDYMFF